MQSATVEQSHTKWVRYNGAVPTPRPGAVSERGPGCRNLVWDDHAAPAAPPSTYPCATPRSVSVQGVGIPVGLGRVTSTLIFSCVPVIGMLCNCCCCILPQWESVLAGTGYSVELMLRNIVRSISFSIFYRETHDFLAKISSKHMISCTLYLLI